MTLTAPNPHSRAESGLTGGVKWETSQQSARRCVNTPGHGTEEETSMHEESTASSARPTNSRGEDVRRRRARDRERMRALRREVRAAYGDACAVCGSTEKLELDHVNGDGKEHRAELGTDGASGSAFYQWLKAQGFPNDPPLQVLCRPCHLDKTKLEALRTHCKRGHEYTPENTYSVMGRLRDGTPAPRYQCRTCRRERDALWYMTHRKHG